MARCRRRRRPPPRTAGAPHHPAAPRATATRTTPATWDRLAQCESGGNWAMNTGNGYYGGLQFSLATWHDVGGTGYPHQASKAEQIERGKILQAQAGWGQWPGCAPRARLDLRSAPAPPRCGLRPRPRPRPRRGPDRRRLASCSGDALAVGDPCAARCARADAVAGAGAELRRRRQHGAAHRAPGRRGAGRPRRRGRRRARVAHARPARGRRRRHGRRDGRAPAADPPRGRRAAGATVVEADAMALDWPALLGRPRASWVLVANLPYNIATPLVLDLLAGAPPIERMLVMVQLEVGERLAAGPGTKAYGIPSVRRAWWADATVVGKVSPTVFVPPPRVESALVDVRRHPPGWRRRPPARRVRAGRGRLRPAPQDAAPVAGRPRDRRRARRRRHPPRGPGRGARARRLAPSRRPARRR